MQKERLLEFYRAHSGEIIGSFIGFVVGVAILVLGIFRVLFLAICVGLGYYIGKQISADKNYIKNLIDRVLPPGTYR